ncbi:hypothetical protein ACFO1B_38185 [Dactylosporangium siamense]|uniref:Septum formation initiator n=1 Tax=Dactylosporangium siamense TaxID=685454 RepID=A0A919UGF1_9ACTN|nr:hypothetical protein [Dactylosporangium siamense]GIG49603.1 hypothetical protein Dsi01nite_076440 [Dactylosporangium siamense]
MATIRRWVLAGAAWLLTVAVATAVATWAVGSMRQGIFGTSDAPYSEADVEARLAASSSGPTPPPPTPPTASASTAAPVPTGVVRALTTPGGTIVAACEAGLVTLRSWAPNAGFEAERVQRGPAAVASLRFKARSGGGDVRAQVTCVDGEPRLTTDGNDD